MTVNSEPVEMSQINFGADGLIPAVCQHYETGQVLVLAFMNKASFHKTPFRLNVKFFLDKTEVFQNST